MNSIVDANYRSAFDSGSGYVTFELVIGGTTYTQEQFTGLHLDAQLFGEYGIGNVNLRTLTAKVADIVSVGDDVQLYAIYHHPDGTDYRMLHSTMVLFRNAKKDGQSDILCYDRLCLTEYVFKRTPTWQERGMLTVAGEIATDIGVTLTDRAQEAIQPWTLPDPGAMTAREVLVEIANSCAGNFCITSDGKLDFIPVGGNPIEGESVVTIDGNGLFQLVAFENLAASDTVVTVDSAGDFQTMLWGDVTVDTPIWYIDSGGYNIVGSQSAPVSVSEVTNKNTEFDSAERQNQYDAYVAVILSNDAGSWYSPSGLTDAQWETLVETGRTLNVTVNFGSQEIADYIYSRITTGLRFIPYTLSGNIDPALDLGDFIGIEPFNGGTYIAAGWSLDATHGRLFGELSANGESEIETLQPYTPKAERMVRRETVERKAAIEVTQDSITSEVSRATAAEGRLSTQIEQTAEGLLITFSQSVADAEDKAENDLTAYSEEVQKYIRFAQGLIELGERDAQIKAVLQSTKLSFYGENGQEAAWISNNQLFINEAVVNGKLTMQDINQLHKWVRTVNPTDGHLSLQYNRG